MSKRRAFQAAYYLAASLSFLPMQAHAAAVPRAAEAGWIERQLKEKLPMPLSSPEAEKPQETTAPTVHKDSKIRFVLRGVQLEGSTRYTKQELLPIYEGHLHKETSLAQVNAVVAAITQHYHKAGYVFAQAYLPPQKITDGKVTIKIVEGVITQVVLDGSPDIKQRMIDDMRARLVGSQPINSRVLEEELLLLNDLPGADFKGILEADKHYAKSGGLILRIIENRKAFSAQASIDNYGSRYVGPWQGMLQGKINSLFTDYDQVRARVLTSLVSNEVRYAFLEYAFPLTKRLTVLVNGSVSHSEPGFRLASQEIVSDARSFGFGLRYIPLRSRSENLSFELAFDVNNLETDILSTELSQDNIRVLRFTTQYDTVDNWQGANLVRLTLSQGVDVFGARETGSINLSRAEGHSGFTVLEMTASRTQRISDRVNVYVVGSGQYSAAPLLASEEFGFGGAYMGRAYDSAEITGDQGVSGLIELQYNGVIDSDDIGSQLFAFYDIGRVWNLDTGGQKQSASSTGLGVRFQANDAISGEFMAAFPLTRDPSTPLSGNSKFPRIGVSFRYIY